MNCVINLIECTGARVTAPGLSFVLCLCTGSFCVVSELRCLRVPYFSVTFVASCHELLRRRELVSPLSFQSFRLLNG